MSENPQGAVIETAGGLVWRKTPRGAELAVIYRSRTHDWTLPKGHLEAGETWRMAAAREVLEETGCKVRIGSFAGRVRYAVKGAHKIALFWNMLMEGKCQFQPSNEAAELTWMTVDEALHKLKHAGERRLVREVADKKWPGKYTQESPREIGKDSEAGVGAVGE